MKRTGKVLMLLILPALLLVTTYCGGGGGGTTGGGELTTTQKSQATALLQAVVSSLGLYVGYLEDVSVEPTSVDLKADVTADCPGGGTVFVNDARTEIIFTACTIGFDSISFEYDGTISLDFSDDTAIATYDLSVARTDATGTERFTIRGTISISDTTLSANMTGTFDGVAFSIVATLTENPDETITGSITITVDGASATCIFENFDPATATEDDFAAACGF